MRPTHFLKPKINKEVIMCGSKEMFYVGGRHIAYATEQQNGALYLALLPLSVGGTHAA